jgi:acyl-CoA synthetase (AMP-forming)/AMP-acid ligase II
MRMIDYFDRAAERFPNRAALVHGSSRLSFRELQDLTRRVAVAMRRAGFKRQEPAALYGPNSPDVMTALLSLWRAEATWAPVNTRNAVAANIDFLKMVRCAGLFYHSSVAADVAKLKAGVPSLKHFVCIDRPLDGDPSLADFIADARPEDWRDEHADPFGNLNDLVGIFATGGTTGASKGVCVTNLGMGTFVETAQEAWGGRTDDPVCLTVAPITHAAGPVALATLGLGATQVILPGFDAEAVLAAIEQHRITHMFLPPTALYGLLDAPSLGRRDVSSLRIFLLAGSPVSPDKFKRAVEAFGPCMCQSYGQVECPMVVTWLPPETVAAAAAGDHPERLASCGLPTRSVRVELLDEEGRPVPLGEPGEICVRGPLVSQGYFERPDTTAEARLFGWHHTGDVGRRDADGYVYIVDRKKDMIVTGGFNVFSAEVEAAVMELPGVRECAVIGVPDAKWGEAVKAVVALSPGARLEADAILAHTKARLGGVKSPKSVDFVDAIPRTPAGKPDKKQLRARYWQGQERAVH